jgi:hypothetical protein
MTRKAPVAPETDAETDPASPDDAGGRVEPTNSVVLVGRVTTAGEQRQLPSGDLIATFRLSVPRRRTPLTGSPGSPRTGWTA